MTGLRKFLCPSGHDKRVTGISENRACRECSRERRIVNSTARNGRSDRQTPAGRMSKRYCKRGHDVLLTGRHRDRSCKMCKLDQTRQWAAKNPDRQREFQRRSQAKRRMNPVFRQDNITRGFIWRHTTAMGATADNRKNLRKAGRLA